MRKFNGASLRVLGLAALVLSFGSVAQAQGFTDWASVLKPGATVAVGGVSQEFAYTSGAGGVTSVSPPSTNMAVTVTETLNAAGEVVSLVMQNANRTVSFYRSNGDTLSPIGSGRLIYGRATDWSRQALAADPTSLGWAFQTFGVWQSGIGMPTGSMGAASVGSITAGAAVPQTGAATFGGLMAGIYNDSLGQDHVVSADMILNVDFAKHSADFRTYNTQDRFGANYRSLDITGSFLSLPNHPALFGTLNTTKLTGTGSAQFYGPAAEEVGGVFTLTPKSGTSLERLAGAFGGKRGPPPPNFVSWGVNVDYGALVIAAGSAQELVVKLDDGYLTEVLAPSTVGAATYSQTISPDGYLTNLHLTTPSRTLGFDAASGDYLSVLRDAPMFIASSKDGERVMTVADPFELGWDYQTFGAWQTVEGDTAGSAGVFSVGAVTPAAAIPISGSATFLGVASGLYISGEGEARMGAASVTLTADFAARRATFGSGLMTSIFDGESFAGTSMSGTLTYAPGQNNLTGTLTTERLSGSASARFYGPAAQEVGGVFTLTPTAGSTGFERLVGSFGAQR